MIGAVEVEVTRESIIIKWQCIKMGCKWFRDSIEGTRL